MSSQPQYFGKFRAVVVDVDDPDKRGRVRVKCPKVLGEGKSKWCEVCSPVAYEDHGDFCLPKKDDTVWVEFENGNPNKPIYVGAWWSNEHTSAADEYGDDIRIIEFDGCKIKMKSDESIETTIKNSKVLMKENETTVSVGDNCEIKLTDKTIELSVGSATLKLDGDSGKIYLNS